MNASRQLNWAVTLALMPAFALPAFAADNNVLEVVMVTAQKRAESLQEVPVSITALTADQLGAMKLDNPSSLATHVPNLQANGEVGDETPVFSLRGISMLDYGLNQSSPVAVYLDEVYKGNFAILGVDLYDLERVEVLRGPQGTLYGKNSTGGAINFIARKPEFETNGYLTAGFGSFNRRDAQGAFQTALVQDTLAARIAFTYAEADGWFEGMNGSPDMNGLDQYAARLSLLYEANDSLDMLLKLSTSRQNPYNYGIYGRPGPEGVGGGVYPAFGLEAYFREGLGRDEIETDYHPKRKHDNDAVALTINWNLNDTVALTSITSWDKGELFSPEDTDGSPLQMISVPYVGRTRQWTQDLRLTSSGESAFNYIAGAYYIREELFNSTELGLFLDIDANDDGTLDFNDCIDSGIIGCRFGNQFDQDRESYALYTDVSYQLTEPLKLRLGLRYTSDKGDLTNFIAQMRGSDGVPLANIIPGDPDNVDATTTRSLKNEEVTGRVGLDWIVRGDNLLYVSFSHGYRSGAFSGQAFFDPSELTVVEPESVDSYEIGAKMQWLDGRLQANVSAFYFVYRDQQIIDVDPVTLAQPLINLPRSEVKGAEFEVVALPVPALTVRAGLGLLDAKIKEATLNGQDMSGTTLPSAPEVTANLSTEWRAAQWGESSGLTLFLDASYTGEQFFKAIHANSSGGESYTLLDARLLFQANESWDIAAWGRNLTDEFYVTMGSNLLGSFGFEYIHRGAPRSYGLDASYKF